MPAVLQSSGPSSVESNLHTFSRAGKGSRGLAAASRASSQSPGGSAFRALCCYQFLSLLGAPWSDSAWRLLYQAYIRASLAYLVTYHSSTCFSALRILCSLIQVWCLCPWRAFTFLKRSTLMLFEKRKKMSTPVHSPPDLTSKNFYF